MVTVSKVTSPERKSSTYISAFVHHMCLLSLQAALSLAVRAIVKETLMAGQLTIGARDDRCGL